MWIFIFYPTPRPPIHTQQVLKSTLTEINDRQNDQMPYKKTNIWCVIFRDTLHMVDVNMSEYMLLNVPSSLFLSIPFVTNDLSVWCHLDVV